MSYKTCSNICSCNYINALYVHNLGMHIKIYSISNVLPAPTRLQICLSSFCPLSHRLDQNGGPCKQVCKICKSAEDPTNHESCYIYL
ncbi:hypothetical protein XELAEV_18037549mg [Xenopus laevis]|uniref:Uncharacterized protein n=1 Tax=Xenopus laevis TaxID=8355 RepID=A0A974HAA9_XENLA|nr:hypothetical protein XELAEV_18037549mg [Xenopus laevis]